jgi:hypothetical protein
LARSRPQQEKAGSVANKDRAFLDFLSKPEALDDGVQYYFRPAQNGAQTLSARLSPAVRAQYKSAYTSVDLPPYDALNEAAAQWRTEMKQ